MVENLITVIIVVISVAGGLVGLVYTGLNIGKGKKKYIERDEHKEAVSRIHERIDETEDDIKGLKKTTNILENEIKGVKEDIAEIKFDGKETKTLMHEMNNTMIKMSVRFDEYMRIKNN